MSTLIEKSEIIAKFKTFNATLIKILNSDDIAVKSNSAREAYVDLQLRELFRDFLSDISDNKSIDQIVTEINNTLMIIKDHMLQFENKPLATSIKKALFIGSQYVSGRLESLKLEYAETIRTTKLKNKGKFDDVVITEKAYALFIILAEKHGLISKIPKANEKAIAFSALTNISDQTLRDNIGSRYQINPNELLLKKDNLEVLKLTLLNICYEIDLIEPI
jgi:hypothetical protein